MPIHAHCCQEREGTPSRLFGNQWYKNYTLLHTFLYKCGCSCALYDVYDAKPQLVKTPVEGKPSTISPNHTCQCSLLILSYNISPSHFSIAHYTFNTISFSYNGINMALPSEFIINMNSKILYSIGFLKNSIMNIIIIIKEVLLVR